MNQNEVTRFIAERYGPDAGASLTPLGGGDWSRAFSFDLEGRGLVVRFGGYQEDFLKDRAAMTFAGPALPIPSMLHIGEALDGFYAVSERHSGVSLETLDEPGWQALLSALLSGFDALRSIELPGSVHWAGDGGATSLGWREWLVDSLEDKPGGRVSGWRAKLEATPETAELFATGERTLHSLLWACPEARHLLHRDLLNRNVLVADDASRLEAVFDWGCSLAGDFLYEVAWLTFWAPWYPALESLDIRRVIREHCRRIGLVVEHFDERFFCYELQIGLEHLAYSAFTGRDDDLQTVARRTRQILEPQQSY